jgi:hypothetical protein
MQPFDDGPFDERYDDVLSPAIKDAGLEPYRVDRDPGASIPIEDIEHGIRNSRICLADITEDNPNVWFELGYAIAVPKDVVLVCSTRRTSLFPFDVQHRAIIQYKTESPQDFDELRREIAKRTLALLAKESKLDLLSSISPLKDMEGLSQHEIVCLVAVVQNCLLPNEGVVPRQVKEDMSRAGFNDLAASLGLRSLLAKEMIEFGEEYDSGGDTYSVYKPTDTGVQWLMRHQDRIVLHASD